MGRGRAAIEVLVVIRCFVETLKVQYCTADVTPTLLGRSVVSDRYGNHFLCINGGYVVAQLTTVSLNPVYRSQFFHLWYWPSE